MSGWPAILLFLPLLLLRYGIVRIAGGDAPQRTDYFPPLPDQHRWALPLYQGTLVAMVLLLIFARIDPWGPDLLGISIYLLGVSFYAVSTWVFACSSEEPIRTSGPYRISRNPMYVAFFLALLGSGLLIGSILFLLLLVTHQVAVHRLILSEEAWCQATFGEDYRTYAEQVRRYL